MLALYYPKPDIMNWNLFNDPGLAFQISQQHETKYFKLVDYYPKNKYPDVPASEDSNRKMIWNFKEGRNSAAIGKMVARALYNTFKAEGMPPEKLFHLLYFSVIPASSKSKTENRFRLFCNTVCEETGMKNGYDLIKVAVDHEVTKGNRNKDIIPFLEFDKVRIRNAGILLFDDVKTTGKSFGQCGLKLKELGASYLWAAFLGEAYDTYKNGPPHWQRTDDDFFVL